MLRKMYLVSADHYLGDKWRRPLSSPSERKKRSRGSSRLKKQKHHSYEEWAKMRIKIRETDIRRKTQTKTISDFLRWVMPDTATPNSNRALPSPEPELAKQLIVLKKTRSPSPIVRHRKRYYTRPLNKNLFPESVMIMMTPRRRNRSM